MSNETELKKLSLVFKVRLLQFLFFSIFAFGLSWFISDLLKVFKLPVSTASIGTMIFGITGIVGCEIIIRWINKLFFQKTT